MRDLIEKLQQIEEGAFKELQMELDNFEARKPDAAPEEVVAHIRKVMGDDAAEYVAKHVVDLQEGEEGQECKWWAMCDNPATTTEPHPILGDVPICDRCVAKLRKIEGLDENYEEERSYDDFVDYYVQDLSSSIVRKGVFQDLYKAAGNDIDVLNAAIKDEAYSIADSYYGTGEGIGTSDMNHFIQGIGKQLGVDDLFGWYKKKDVEEEAEMKSDEEMERDKTNRYAKYNAAIRRNQGLEEDSGHSIFDILSKEDVYHLVDDLEYGNYSWRAPYGQKLDDYYEDQLPYDVITGDWGDPSDWIKEKIMQDYGDEIDAIAQEMGREQVAAIRKNAGLSEGLGTWVKDKAVSMYDKKMVGYIITVLEETHSVTEAAVSIQAEMNDKQIEQVVGSIGRFLEAHTNHPMRGDLEKLAGMIDVTINEEGADVATAWGGPYEEYENYQGKKVKIDRTQSGEHEGEVGTVVKADKYRDENGGWQAEFDVQLDSGETIKLYPGEWSYDQLRLVVDPYQDFMLDNPFESLEEGVVKVPRGLRGEEGNPMGLTSQDAEDFINSLGPDDVVATDVVDPETGELLDWPDRGTRRARGQKEWERKERERKEQEEKDHEEGYDAPYLYVPNIKSDPESAWDTIWELKNDREITDFYHIVWRSVRDVSGEPFDLGADTEDWGELDYDVDIDMPVAIKRTDGKKFNKQDRKNFDVISKVFRAATGNIAVQFVGSSNEGTVARFVPTFM